MFSIFEEFILKNVLVLKNKFFLKKKFKFMCVCVVILLNLMCAKKTS